ncbi:MAG TPA: MoaD/ThiS family protein [Bacteroidales bacterium]|nr:MoaD/ThiS family protein [Bacteroidales bacterium]
MDVKVMFFGVLAEVTGTTFLNYTGVKTLSDLRQRITDRHPEIVHYNYRIAVNNLFTDDDCTLSDGDEVAFLPPFAGG